MSLTKKMPKNRTSANNSHGDVDAEAADADARLELVDAASAAADARLELVDAASAAADARLELVDAASAAADARLELVDAAAAAVADRLPLAANRYSDHCRLSCDELRRYGRTIPSRFDPVGEINTGRLHVRRSKKGTPSVQATSESTH